MRKKLLVLIVFLFFINGCSDSTSITDSSSSSVATSSVSASSSSSSVSTSSVSANTNNSNNSNSEGENITKNKYHPIVFDGILIGGFNNSSWLKSSEILKYIRGGEVYKLYSKNEYIGDAVGSKGTPPPKNEPGTERVDIDFTVNTKDLLLAFNGDWNGLPRVPVLQSNLSNTYKQIVFEFLKSKGLTNIQVNIRQNYRIDLEGDGTDEVLLTADNLNPVGVTMRKNTYSIIILRKIINGKVENIMLREEVYTKDGEFSDGTPYLFNIENICDVNGDGIMEVLIGYEYYEGFGYELVEIKNNGFKNVLSNGMGA